MRSAFSELLSGNQLLELSKTLSVSSRLGLLDSRLPPASLFLREVLGLFADDLLEELECSAFGSQFFDSYLEDFLAFPPANNVTTDLSWLNPLLHVLWPQISCPSPTEVFLLGLG